MHTPTNSTAEIVPSDEETRAARGSRRVLAPLLRHRVDGREVRLRLCSEGHQDEDVTLPGSVLRLLAGALDEIAGGRGVALVPLRAELTTQQAADLLQVSRPFLIKLLDAGKIPHRRVGAHRRIAHGDVLRYAQQERLRREQVMAELAAETERLGL